MGRQVMNMWAWLNNDFFLLNLYTYKFWFIFVVNKTLEFHKILKIKIIATIRLLKCIFLELFIID